MNCSTIALAVVGKTQRQLALPWALYWGLRSGKPKDRRRRVSRSLVSILPLTFITSSENKLQEVERLLGQQLSGTNVALDEIQDIALEPVVVHKVRQAYAQVQRPVLVEDTGLTFAAWNGLPGALVKWFLTALGTEGLCRLLQGE